MKNMKNMKKLLKNKKDNINKGFTLVETLIAISIFTVSVLALLIILSKGISDTEYAKRKMTAEYLAQEGIEYMRNMRDTFSLYASINGNNGWDNFKNRLSIANCDTDTCYFDDQKDLTDSDPNFNLFNSDGNLPITHIFMTKCPDPSCPHLMYDATNARYDYSSSGQDSGYIRTIKVNFPTNPDEATIISTVSWVQGSGTYNATFSEELFNWIE